MNFWSMLLNDPIVMFSLGGLAILLLICAYYVYYFIKQIQADKN